MIYTEEIALISCGKKKDKEATVASKLYTGTLFKLQYEYAKKRGAKIFILSAKYYLLDPDSNVKFYDKTLNKMHSAERKEWADKVLEQLQAKTDLEKDHFIVLAGSKYIEFLLPSLKDYELPLEHKRIGEQMQFLKKRLNE